ncbi:MAG TPA: glycosyltransferase family 2 protein [Gemmataceae bacterium]
MDAAPAPPPPDTDLGRELEAAHRRISQLETALMRRNELLEQKHAALTAIYSSGAWKLVRFYYKLRDRLFPLHSRRRNALKYGIRSALRVAKWLAGLRGTLPGATGEGLGAAPDPDVYRLWINKYEPKRAELERQRRHTFARSPKVSVVVPAYNTPAKFLEAMLQSVLAQTYANWELCVADGASAAPWVRPILEKYAKADPRVRVQFLGANAGIVGNSNAALAAATGDYVAFLDHDDTLAPFALYEVVAALNEHPDADFLYSDEDKLTQQGERAEPNFKPDWSPETLRGRNYVCHLTVLKRDLVTELGGFREGFDGAQDHDLVLRASERARKIVHIPKILYHWRMHEQSTAAFNSSKRYAFEAGKRAVAEHLTRLGIAASVTDGPILGTYHVIYHLPTQPLVSVIIPNRDQAALLARCMNSLARSSYANYEVLVVENGSELPDTFAYYRELEKQPHVRVLRWAKPFNYAAVNNFAATHARGELLLFLNNDVEAINPDWMEAMAKLAVQPGVGAVGAKLYYADDTVQHAGIILGMGGVAGHSHLHFPRAAPGYMQRLLLTQNCAAVTGACLMTPKKVFDEVGGFDEGFVLAFNDVDLCVQILQRGYRVVWTPDAELYHLESKTRGYEDTDEKQKRFKREIDLFHNKWGDLLKKGDPYYSPHFRLDRADFCLRT